MGTRMLAALWNFRANLINFCDNLDNFEKDNNLTDERTF
jgi:hypothetical protein